MNDLKRTVLYGEHGRSGAKFIDFGGWEMPVQYETGISAEHLGTRLGAGLFDVSHMGRFLVSGAGAPAFLQYVLTNNAAALSPGESQYTIIPDANGCALDDAYLYYFRCGEYVLVVNASNREKDWGHLSAAAEGFEDVLLEDVSEDLAMISIQGPKSRAMLEELAESGTLPEPLRNSLSTVVINGYTVDVARTGYTGEPIGFELFVPSAGAAGIWRLLTGRGAVPAGLGARDTLRLEAALPLYGHELGTAPDGSCIPVFALSLAAFAVSFSPVKGDYIGRAALKAQHDAKQRILRRDYSDTAALPRRIFPVAITGSGIAREGSPVFRDGKPAGWITSGTAVPYQDSEGRGIYTRYSDSSGRRSIALALLDSDLVKGDRVQVEVRGKMIEAVVVMYHLRSEAPPFTRPVDWKESLEDSEIVPAEACGFEKKALNLLRESLENTRWRRYECINLIPSEMTPSSMARVLSVADPAGRYAEHKKVKAFLDDEVFYYQGTEFIERVEDLLASEMAAYLGCNRIESRIISGQMANAALFSAMVDYINRGNRRAEPRRMRCVMNNHIIRGGHLSAQPMGALRDYVARDPLTEQPAVVSFPVLADNPYRIDVAACADSIEKYRPELIILGKSMILHKEPVAEIRGIIDSLGLDTVLMYDMAHVLGLVGPYFQDPFREGADIVTGSTHKTYFGTQRGIIAGNLSAEDARYPLWEAVERRAFPGCVSNHHLGTLVGLLMSAYEMNCFKDEYQRSVITNAKAFARALKAEGLDVAGDPSLDFTETHQVVVNVGYARGPEIARRLEENNIIVNYQSTPREEGFSASAAIRLGVSEMTRYGMAAEDFAAVAALMADIVLRGRNRAADAAALRSRFTGIRYCFSGGDFDDYLQKLMKEI